MKLQSKALYDLKEAYRINYILRNLTTIRLKVFLFMIKSMS